MLIYKMTNTLDGFLPPLNYTDDSRLAEILLVGGKKINLADFPRLKGLFKTGVGTDNLPYEEACRRGVSIALPSAQTCDVIYEETSAFACHLILAGLYAGAGDWGKWGKPPRSMLGGRRLLIIGNGRIGKRVAAKMSSFMLVDTYDVAENSPESLEPKVRAADCVTLHVPLTASTNSFFDAKHLAWMRDGALLVNTARGAIVDEAALYAELSSGRLRAAFDVFWEEPYAGRLNELPDSRFIKSPHIASSCREFLVSAVDDLIYFIDSLAESHGCGK